MISDAEQFNQQKEEDPRFDDIQKQLNDIREWVGKHKHTLTDKTQPLPQQAIPTTTRTQFISFLETGRTLASTSGTTQYAHGFGIAPRFIRVTGVSVSATSVG